MMQRRALPVMALLLFAMQIAVVPAQTTDKPTPEFTLTLSRASLGGSLSKTTQVLSVTYTNISKGVDPGNTCATRGVFRRLKVVFNGVPVEQTKEDRQFDQALDKGNCIGANAAMVLQPGESKRGYLEYSTAKPGTYEFTVEQGTFPRDPTKNVVVRSNRVTIVVPERGEAYSF